MAIGGGTLGSLSYRRIGFLGRLNGFYISNTFANLKNSLLGGCRGCRGDSIPSDNLCYKVKLLCWDASPQTPMHPRDNLCYKAMQPRRSIPVSDFLAREQKSDTGMLSPLHLINARENGEGIV